MAYTDTSSSFTSLTFREDSDGKIWIKATALADLTAGTPYLCFVGSTSYEAQAVFDTGVTASGALAHGAYIGVPKAAISSDSSGWLQIGGYNASVTLGETSVTAGSAIMWDAATFSSTDATYTGASNEWANTVTSESTGSNTAFAIYQVPKLTYGSS